MAAEASARAAPARLGLEKSRLAALWRQRGRVVHRLGWGVADQAVSSLTNFAVSIYVVRTLGAVQFGAFSLAYVTYAFALTASRGLATGPLEVRFSGTDLPTWRRAVAGSTGTAAVVGLVTGACVLAVTAALTGTARAAFLALGLTLPGLLLQDSWRYSFFALGRGSQAFLNDLIWAAALLPALVFLRVTGHADVFWYVFAWGAAAAVGAAAGPLQARVVPRLTGAWGWVARHGDLGFRYLGEGASGSGSAQLRGYGIGLILGLAAVGYVGAAGTLMGPMTILFMGMSLVTIPEAARVVRRSPRHLPLFCLLVSGGLAAAAFAWGVVVLVALPRGLGSSVLGPIWRPTYPLVLPMALSVVGQGAGIGAAAGLHGLGAARRSLRTAVLGSVAFLVFSLLGAATGGAVGTVRGAAVASWIAAVLWWWQLRVELRKSGHAPADRRRWPSSPAGWHRKLRRSAPFRGGSGASAGHQPPPQSLWQDGNEGA
jgi:O-antigen/teichoic acid export membrane protein